VKKNKITWTPAVIKSASVKQIQGKLGHIEAVCNARCDSECACCDVPRLAGDLRQELIDRRNKNNAKGEMVKWVTVFSV
jgi:hypothetical protein